MPGYHLPSRRFIVDPRRRRAFTLVEMLVVVVIIITLLAILVPILIGKIRPNPAEVRMLTSIGFALDAYESDFGDIPPSDHTQAGPPISFGAWDGGEILTQALVGTLPNGTDGKLGFGFRAGAALTGKSYGPYLDIKHEKSLHERAPGRWVFTVVSSQSMQPVLYYRADPSGTTGDLDSANAIWSAGGRFDTDHNDTLDGADDPTDYWSATADADKRRSLTFSMRSAEYLLVSSGYDETFGDAGGGIEYDDAYLIGR